MVWMSWLPPHLSSSHAGILQSKHNFCMISFFFSGIQLFCRQAGHTISHSVTVQIGKADIFYILNCRFQFKKQAENYSKPTSCTLLVFLKSLELEAKFTRQNKQPNLFLERTVFPHFLFLCAVPQKVACNGHTICGSNISSNSFWKADCCQLLYNNSLWMPVDTLLPVIWSSSYQLLFKLQFSPDNILQFALAYSLM